MSDDFELVCLDCAEVPETCRGFALVEARAQQAGMLNHAGDHERAQPAHGAAKWCSLQRKGCPASGIKEPQHLHLPKDWYVFSYRADTSACGTRNIHLQCW